MRERFTPGGFDTIKAAASEMRRLMGVEDGAYDYADPYTLIVYNQQNQVAAKLIGIFANQNANAAMTSLMSRLELASPIAFGEHATVGLTNLLAPNTLSKELLAASVDAVKDPCLSMLNFNTITASSVAMLTRLGYSFKDIGLLLNQPAIKQLTKECLDKGIRDVSTQIDIAIEALNADDLVDLKEDNLTRGLTSEVLQSSLQRLSKNSNTNNYSNADRQTQIKALSLFKQIVQQADELNKFVGATRFTAANSVKSTFGEMYAQQLRVSNYVVERSSKKQSLVISLSDFTQQESPILDGEEYDISDFDNMKLSAKQRAAMRMAYAMKVVNNPFGYEQVMYDTAKAALKKMGKYFPYGYMESLRQQLSNATIGTLNGDTINAFHKAVIKHILSQDETSPFNENRIIRNPDGTEVSYKEYCTKYIPYRIQATLNKYPELKNNPLFQLSTFDIDNDNNVIFKLLDSGALSPADKENITMGWEQLIELGLEDLAKDIYMYNYFMSGFGFGVIGFNHLAPVSVKERIGTGENSYLERLWNIMGYNSNDSMSAHVNYNELMRNFIIDNADNYQLVYTPSKEVISKLYKQEGAVTMPLSKFRVSDVIRIDGSKSDSKIFQISSSNGTTQWKAAIRIPQANGKDLLYIANSNYEADMTGGVEQAFNVTTDGSSICYVRAIDESTGKPVELSNISTYETDAMSEGTGSSRDPLNDPKTINFGETTHADTLDGFKQFAKNASEILAKNFPSIGTAEEMYKEIMSRYGESIGAEHSTAQALADLKNTLKAVCEENGYRGAVDNELIC